jgi:hypothetical protein
MQRLRDRAPFYPSRPLHAAVMAAAAIRPRAWRYACARSHASTHEFP